MTPSHVSVVRGKLPELPLGPLPLPSLADEPLLDVVRLIRTPTIGPITFFTLIRRFGSAKEALARVPELALRGGRKTALQTSSPEQAEKEIAAATRFGACLAVYGQAEYPSLLQMISDPPPVITLMGNSMLAQRPCVGVVGARNASANGCAFAKKISAELGEAGITVVSGLARGIDTFAHQGALAHGTVAVIAGGIDTVYPPENARLTQQIREQGLVISEQPFGATPFAAAFPGRNRIIAGISAGTLIVEAAPKSGSLITARFAAEQGRDVFAVPGHPLDPRAKGCNRLLKSGAMLVEDAADILHALSLPRTRDLREIAAYAFDVPATELSDAEAADVKENILARLGAAPVSSDILRAQCDVTPGVLSAALIELELAGHVMRSAGGMVARSMAEC